MWLAIRICSEKMNLANHTRVEVNSNVIINQNVLI